MRKLKKMLLLRMNNPHTWYRMCDFVHSPGFFKHKKWEVSFLRFRP